MKLLLDMNLSPAWVGFLRGSEIEAQHWSEVGDPRASDEAILAWACAHGFIIFTHDLDFSTLLALTRTKGPSALQARAQDVLPEAIGADVIGVLQSQAQALAKGAIVTLDEIGARVRILPII